MSTDSYTRENYVYELFDRMKHDQKYRPVIKGLAKKGDADAVATMVLWDKHVKEQRRAFAR
ncbi:MULTISPECIES: hypothetical protein [Acidithiobacillus]|uniref:hypothetical protein n=1 Tax=Acidithiobacillus ferrooxidans TaxID=920 RepID=UPI001C072697|nr:hypothetical protein [Acidithiobacillus ferrooxidans]MBU2859745.1 hypothetical protein [Acidithiobacillus ferrooxidans]